MDETLCGALSGPLSLAVSLRLRKEREGRKEGGERQALSFSFLFLPPLSPCMAGIKGERCLDRTVVVKGGKGSFWRRRKEGRRRDGSATVKVRGIYFQFFGTCEFA